MSIPALKGSVFPAGGRLADDSWAQQEVELCSNRLVRSLAVSHSVHGGSGASGTGGFSGGMAVKDPPARAGDSRGAGSPQVGKTPWRRTWQPAPVSSLGNLTARGACWAAVRGAAESDSTRRLSRNNEKGDGLGRPFIFTEIIEGSGRSCIPVF